MTTADEGSREAGRVPALGAAEPRTPNWAAIGNNLFAQMRSEYVQPEPTRRMEAGEWQDQLLYRWQVLLPWRSPAVVRFNREVGGSLTAKAARAIQAGEEVMVEDIADIQAYTPRDEDAEVPHVTAFMHAGGWSVAFEFGYRDPHRHEHVQAGLEFLATARHAYAAARLRAFAESAFSAVELLAKAELLSSAPTVELALAARRHGGVATPYSLWARLGNTDGRFARLLNQLAEMRPAARYLNREFSLTPEDAEAMLVVLEEMAEHVRQAAEEPASEGGYQVIAARPIRAGTLVGPDDITLKPTPSAE